MARKSSPNRDVFINCPFDPDFLDIFRAIVFALRACGYRPRCTKDDSDSAVVRIDKILDLIESCDWGIHDLSAVQLDTTTGAPRFNMPLELGISIGARRFGGRRQRIKRLLILERDPHRYDASTSDLSGQDIDTHGGEPEQAIRAVRNWLSANAIGDDPQLPGSRALTADYAKARASIDDLIAAHRFDPWKEMTHRDYLICLDVALQLLAQSQPR